MNRAALAAATALVLGCAPVVQPPGPAVRAPALETDAIFAGDGRHLPLRRWPAQGDERLVVLALHGFNDYSNAFAEPAAWWAAQGVSVYAYDQRGFGATDHRGLWPGVEVLVDDLKAAIQLVKARHPDRPLYLVGESMGGAVIMAAMAADAALPVDGAVLAAPAVWGRANMSWLYRQALWFVAHVMPWYPLSGRGLQIRASDNHEMLLALGRDPLVIHETRADAVWGLVNLMDAARAAAPDIAQPVLLLYGERDELIPKPPVEQMIKALRTPHRIVVYAQGWHMLLRDNQRQVVWRDCLAWMLDRQGPLPSGFERHGLPLFAAD